jgi:hypothetical protein
MTDTTTTYRKLPGRLRGLGYGASVWLGPDHLLLARTGMFRESYARYYLRDIQAIVVAECPRFLLSVRAIVIGFLWMSGWLFFSLWPAGFAVMWSGAAVALIATWLIVSSANSCRCRIYTAVSNQELPSLYRIRAARKFLAEVQPLIGEVQGAVDSNWAQAVEARRAGPDPAAAVRVATVVSEESPGPAVEAPVPPVTTNRTPVSEIFIACVLVGAVVDLATLRSVTNIVRWIDGAFALIQVVLAVWVLIQCYRRSLSVAMQRLAIAVLVLMGLGYYAASAFSTVSGRATPILDNATLMQPQFILLREIYSGLAVLLGVIGIVLILGDNAARQADMMDVEKEPEVKSQERE